MDDATHERWATVEGFPNYEVSDLGRVYSLPRRSHLGGLLKPWVNDKGYLCVTLYRTGHVKKIPVHQLVATAFLGPCPEGMEVLHGPNGKRDNRAVHLRYGTHLENVRDMERDGTRRRGESHQSAVLTMAMVSDSRRRYAAGELLGALAREYSVYPLTLEDAIQGHTWRECAVPPVVGHKRGEDHRDAKLTDAIVRECRARFAAGATYLGLSREFGVSYVAMRNAVIGKTWKHVT